MSWLKAKKDPVAHAHHHAPHVSREVQARIADFLRSHDRLESRNGHPLMHVIGTSHNHFDGSDDYAIRSRVRRDGKEHRYDSHVRVYPTGHLRLIR